MPTKRYPPQRAYGWFRLPVLVIGALVLLAACGGSNTPSTDTATPTPASGSAQLLMILTNSNGSFGFSRATLTIKVGTTVTWKNVSGVAHTVTSDDGQTFDSGTVAADGTFHFTFKAAGTFAYHCNYHPYMRATIVVV